MANRKIPKRISSLDELANNLWWSWHDEAREVFRALDYPLWKICGHNPVKMLREVSPDKLKAAARDPDFLSLYDSIISAFEVDTMTSNTWFSTSHPDLLDRPVAYFSMEYAIHNSLPLYAGGLGILAGDICKEASDLGIPMAAVGFMYPQGYFHQHLCSDLDLCQMELYKELNFEEAPISRVLSPRGKTTVAEVQLGNTTVAIGVWRVRVGRTNIYLLDTNLEGNPTSYRQLTARLYVADRELRMQQEIVLGIGGVRVLRALGISPAVWHANEGHTAFMTLERMREKIAGGASFNEAVRQVQAKTVFTTHTPVLAGHDVFPEDLVDKYFHNYWESMGIKREDFFQLWQQRASKSLVLNMTALALQMSDHRSAVSALHGEVTRRMWHNLWPEVPEEQVPITHVTNGIHVPTWVAPELYRLFEKYLGKDWLNRHDDKHFWDALDDMPDEELWAVHQDLKRKLAWAIRERMRSRWLEDDVPWPQMMSLGALLDPEALTIAFTRRFAEYKRPALIFQDVERLKKIINDQSHPVQIIFAGKSHPADFPSKFLLQKVHRQATDRSFKGRIIFVEDYDMHIARYLVHGVDVWLNTPRRLQEACGTSGMKAALNGVLHLSVRDGWWHEGYNGANGWAIGDDRSPLTPEEEDRSDATALYHLLEEEVVPFYYSRDINRVPRGWVSLMKESIRSIVPQFCARRMLKEYTERMYIETARVPD